MSVIYFGLYVTCKTCEIQKTIEITTCSNSKCRSYNFNSKHLFCSICGSKITKRNKISLVDNVDISDLDAIFKEKLRCFVEKIKDNNFHLWIVNVIIPNMRKLSFNSLYEGKQLIPISKEKINDEVILFAELLKKELEIIKEKYGESNVEIKWGLKSYYYYY